jgi:hypothetical protein
MAGAMAVLVSCSNFHAERQRSTAPIPSQRASAVHEPILHRDPALGYGKPANSAWILKAYDGFVGLQTIAMVFPTRAAAEQYLILNAGNEAGAVLRHDTYSGEEDGPLGTGVFGSEDEAQHATTAGSETNTVNTVNTVNSANTVNTANQDVGPGQGAIHILFGERWQVWDTD